MNLISFGYMRKLAQPGASSELCRIKPHLQALVCTSPGSVNFFNCLTQKVNNFERISEILVIQVLGLGPLIHGKKYIENFSSLS